MMMCMRPALSLNGIGALPRAPDADGIDPHPHRSGRFGRVQRTDFSGVVHTVREQNGDLRFRRRHAQPIDAGGDAFADGGSIVDRGDGQVREVLLQPVVIQRERTDQRGHPGEGDETDAIVGPLLDEFRDHGFDDLDAADAPVLDGEVQCLHRTGDVESQNDIDAVQVDDGAAVHPLRAGETRDHQDAGDDGAGAIPIDRSGCGLARATSRTRPTLEYSMAATGPCRPRHTITSGSNVSSQNHSG